ncbi:MAG: hypothetical protein KC561_01240, partial [Myxococcales bacterium]|nr:hypothetical protein [Myxococcales bacterium]
SDREEISETRVLQLEKNALDKPVETSPPRDAKVDDPKEDDAITETKELKLSDSDKRRVAGDVMDSDEEIVETQVLKLELRVPADPEQDDSDDSPSSSDEASARTQLRLLTPRRMDEPKPTKSRGTAKAAAVPSETLPINKRLKLEPKPLVAKGLSERPQNPVAVEPVPSPEDIDAPIPLAKPKAPAPRDEPKSRRSQTAAETAAKTGTETRGEEQGDRGDVAQPAGSSPLWGALVGSLLGVGLFLGFLYLTWLR